MFVTLNHTICRNNATNKSILYSIFGIRSGKRLRKTFICIMEMRITNHVLVVRATCGLDPTEQIIISMNRKNIH